MLINKEDEDKGRGKSMCGLSLALRYLPHLLSFLHYHFNYGALNFTILFLKALFHFESSHPFVPTFTQQDLSCFITQMVQLCTLWMSSPFCPWLPNNGGDLIAKQRVYDLINDLISTWLLSRVHIRCLLRIYLNGSMETMFH